MVYDRYNYTFHGGYTPTNISNIHPAQCWGLEDYVQLKIDKIQDQFTVNLLDDT